MSVKVMDKGRKSKHLSAYERGRIAALIAEGYTPYRIGRILGRSDQTIRNELKRGTVTVIKGYFEKTEYYPDTGQAIYEKNRKKCKSTSKVKKCKEFLKHVEDEVLLNNRSFDAIHGRVLKEGLFAKEELVCVTTLYNYADRGILRVRNIDLPEKVSRRVKKAPRIKQHKRLKGRSIEERPKEVDSKKEFGHWEIDLVIGKKSDDDALLTLTERKTKMEIIEKIKNKTVDEVMEALGRIENRIPLPDKVLKTITTDNGTEFSRLHELEDGSTVRVYYAHPYSSWERGLNESTNRIIRRFVPKGKPIRNYTEERISEIEDWINTLPRRILNYSTAEEAFEEELRKLSGEGYAQSA